MTTTHTITGCEAIARKRIDAERERLGHVSAARHSELVSLLHAGMMMWHVSMPLNRWKQVAEAYANMTFTDEHIKTALTHLVRKNVMTSYRSSGQRLWAINLEGEL